MGWAITHSGGRQNIQHRMLLHKHCRDAYQHTEQDEEKLQLRVLRPPAVAQTEHCGDGAEDVYQTGGRSFSVKIIKPCDEPRQDVVPSELRQAQILAGREKRDISAS